MNNFEAIQQMDAAAMESFLDQVYLAGLNSGMYASGLPDDSDEQNEILDNNPFDARWLASKAEKATQYRFADDGDEYLLDALTAAVFRNAGIEMDEAGD